MSFITNYLLPYGAIHTVSTSYVELLTHILHCRRHSLRVHTYHFGALLAAYSCRPGDAKVPVCLSDKVTLGIVL